MSLAAQRPTYTTVATKIRSSILATAMVDALGGPVEFKPRFSFPLVTTMLPNKTFSLPPGVWTDDTSMALCLARSLATFTPDSDGEIESIGGFDEKDQLDAYLAWKNHGKLSAVGRCFDIGNTIRQALDIYAKTMSQHHNIEYTMRQIDMRLGGEFCAGNGSLMRVLPVGLAFWRDEQLAREYARRSSKTTHPNLVCQEACEVWTQTIVRIIQASTSADKRFTKLDVVKSFSSFSYTQEILRRALALPSRISPFLSGDEEEYYRSFHPILQLISKAQTVRIDDFPIGIPNEDDLPSSGFVVHTLVAALYCFLATESFEEGAIMAVNLGDDADTVGAVYAGLAACWYSGEEDSGTVFWTTRVKEWREGIVKRKLVEDITNELTRFSDGLAR